MATNHPTVGVMPATNDIVAGGVVLLAYAMRIGYVEEGQAASWVLQVTTDLLLPVLAGLWLFVTAMYVVVSE